MIKKLMWAIVIVLLVSLIMSTVPWSKKIDVKLRGVQSRVGESSEAKEVTVTVKGTYNKYFVKDDTFKGTISISTYGDIWDNSKGELVFSDNTSIMTYINMEGDKVVSGTFGSILCATDFSEVLILVNEQYSLGGSGWTNENGVFISAPAKDREQAIEIADKLGKKDNMAFTGYLEIIYLRGIKMLFIFAGPSCTGKSSVAAELEKLIQVEVYSGKDYLRMGKNQQEAWRQFYNKLELASKTKGSVAASLIYIITEPLELEKVAGIKDSVQIKFTADSEVIKERFTERMKGNLSKSVEAMIVRQLDTWKDIDTEFTVNTSLKTPSEIVKEIYYTVFNN